MYIGQRYRYEGDWRIFEVIPRGTAEIQLMDVTPGRMMGHKYSDTTQTILNNIRNGRLIPLRRTDITFDPKLVDQIDATPEAVNE